MLMKVKLAAQVLSSSVADALDFLREDMKDPSQMGNEATVHFISYVQVAEGVKVYLRAR